MSERGGADRSADRPNVLLFLTDDHTAQAIGAYLNDDAPPSIPDHLAGAVETPNVDRIATGGVRFDGAFCTNSLCAPARASVMTGQYGHHNGVRDNGAPLDETAWTFPAALRGAGYRTGLIGKWHLQSGYNASAGDPPGFDHYEVLAGQGSHWDPVLHHATGETRHEGYTPDVLADRCLAWLDDREPDAPFFLNVGFKATHAPWDPPAADLDAVPDRVPAPETLHDDYETRTGAIRGALKMGRELYEDVMFSESRALDPIPDGLSDREEREWVYRRFVRNYLATVVGVDRNVGRVLDYLDAEGLAGETLVVYAADHGFFLGEHGLVDKRHMYEPALRIPLLARWPGVIDPGTARDELVANVDLAPTLLDAAGVGVPESVQGRSLGPLLRGDDPADWRDAVYYRHYSERWGSVPHEGIRTERHKLIHYHPNDERECYDLETDPRELANLYPDPEHEALRSRLDALLDERRAELDIPAPGGRE